MTGCGKMFKSLYCAKVHLESRKLHVHMAIFKYELFFVIENNYI